MEYFTANRIGIVANAKKAVSFFIWGKTNSFNIAAFLCAGKRKRP